MSLIEDATPNPLAAFEQAKQTEKDTRAALENRAVEIRKRLRAQREEAYAELAQIATALRRFTRGPKVKKPEAIASDHCVASSERAAGDEYRATIQGPER